MSVETSLLAAFTAWLGPVEVQRHDVTPWSSATFSGGRHVFRLQLASSSDVIIFAQNIGDAEIQIPRGFVADVAVVDGYRDEHCSLTIEVLTIDA